MLRERKFFDGYWPAGREGPEGSEVSFEGAKSLKLSIDTSETIDFSDFDSFEHIFVLKNLEVLEKRDGETVVAVE